ncbi:hypothetical protein QBC34DRAFT_408110 [Podospora aff. communis PSN243]|uniref:NADPH-dependent diflavin oxidoreductase 1 n=1 Tax=Podospora aff. communis PSN243 TaxID=3040156 RepID=A0AAV9GL46_9PEZI|nr:hypothetical protein QBC34DRAFT_408110 [Podospora aff. communis PSN243]
MAGADQTIRPGAVPGRSMIVMYGSETGNGEEIAGELGKMAQRLHFQVVVDEMDSFKLSDLLRFSLAIFVTSVTGQGDMPKNTTKFWKNLRREKLSRTKCLAKLKFAIFGLGDSSYPKFNWAARKLRVRLLQLGATEFFRTGEGDERHDNGIDSIYLPWYQELKTHLLTNYPLPDSLTPIPEDVQLPPTYVLRLLHQPNQSLPLESSVPETINGDKPADRNSDLPPSDLLPIPDTFETKLVSNDRMTPPDHWQDVRRLLLDVKCPRDAFSTFAAGATAYIYPKNYPEDVQTLIDLMGWQSVADAPLDLDNKASPGIPGTRSLPPKLHAKPNSTLRDLLTHNLDITSVPKRSFIRQLEFFTPSEMEKERLRELTASGNEQDFYDYTSRPRRTILEMLRDFPNLKIPYDHVLDLFPLIRAREFSICNGGNSLAASPPYTLRIELLIALVEYRTIIRKPRQGLCSRYIRHLPAGSPLAIGFKHPPSAVLDPRNGEHTRPLIAVGTGTGIAPIRALIQDRQVFTSPPPGQTLLFFGCRNEKADYFYRSEWESSPSLQVLPAFSRDPLPASEVPSLHPSEDGLPTAPKAEDEGGIPVTTAAAPTFDYDAGKNYVQHRIRNHAAQIGPLMQRRPIICVCGNAGRMPISVRNALLDALAISRVVDTREAAEVWLSDGNNATYWQETW